MSMGGYRQFRPSCVTDRTYWDGLRTSAPHAAILDEFMRLAEQAPAQPPLPTATDYLAAKRANDRSLLDRHWNADRAQLTALAVRRLARGIDAADGDDKLLNWLWAFLTEASWTVSAHLPGQDLPASGVPSLDLASCEMAAMLAEMREVLKPWMDGHSATLADSIVTEIDRRILTPYAQGVEVWWDNASKRQLNNWLGVCAGSILAACRSLSAQGHPRPQAEKRALDGLRLFLSEACFTPGGECDEGVGYWAYGVGFMCMGLSRLSRDELARHMDMDRLKLIAGYPQRVHLFDDCFYTGNDGPMRTRPSPNFLHWLAGATGVDWLSEWARSGVFERHHLRDLGQAMRLLDVPADGLAPGGPLPPSGDAPRFLPDQQVAILSTPTPRGRMLAILTGGHNAERHNHNDLGHFIIALGNQIIIPDIGAPWYAADFFGPNRYTYLPASSRGHCCPVINGQEQRAGAEAAGRVVQWNPDEPRLTLDLTAAYGPEAQLKRWTRALRRDGAGFVLEDQFRTTAPRVPVVHLIWSLLRPKVDGDGIALGGLRCGVTPRPRDVRIAEVSGAEHRLREHSDKVLYRVEMDYVTDERGELSMTTTFTA